MTSQREDFEESAARMGYSLRIRDQDSEDGEYGDRETQCAWDMWQECCDKAARAQGDAEPAAWLLLFESNQVHDVAYSKESRNKWLSISGRKAVPLYTHPPAAKVQEAFILRKQAEAVDQAAGRLKMSTRWGVEPFRRGMNTAYGHVTGCAQHLHNQADKLEKE